MNGSQAGPVLARPANPRRAARLFWGWRSGGHSPAADRLGFRRRPAGAMEAAERSARQKEQAEKEKQDRMNADLKEAIGHGLDWLG